MAHNFRLAAGAYGDRVAYVSKAGLDTNPGTADAPLATLFPRAYEGYTHLVGTGTYEFPILGRIGGAGSPEYTNLGAVADGLVVLRGDGRTRFTHLSASPSFAGLRFENFGGLAFNYAGQPRGTSGACTYLVAAANADAPNSSASGAHTFTDCVLVNVRGNLGSCTFRRCLLLNCDLDVGALTQCYLDATTRVRAGAEYGNDHDYYQPAYVRTSRNNVDPAADPAQGYGLALAGAPPALASPGGLSAAPAFNAPARGDYTLQAASPHLAADIGPAHLRLAQSFYTELDGAPGTLATLASARFRAAGTGLAVPLLALPPAFEVGPGGGLALRPAADDVGEGTFTTGVVAFADEPAEITSFFLHAGLRFDASYPALESQFNPAMPEVYNQNVPDATNYAAGDAGRNPNRLTYRLRWSTLAHPSPDLANATDWATGTDFVELEWNTAPRYNPATGLGNGHPAFDPTLGQPVVCRCYQLQVVLRHNYYR